MKPDVSVIIPIYNVEKYLPACLDSVINQTHSNIEILLVDDCGTDASMQIARKYAAKDSRIKILTHLKNKGLSAARNTGLQAAQAPFVMFLDSDDYYAPDICEKMLKGIVHSEADLAMCGTSVIYEENEEMKKSDDQYYHIHFRGLQPLCDAVLSHMDIAAWNKIYRVSLLKKYQVLFPEGLRYEDAFFFNAYACWAKTAFFLPEKLYFYRRRAGSIMNQTFRGEHGHSIDHLKIAIKLYEYFKQFQLLELRRNYLMDFILNYFRLSLAWEASREGKKEICKLLSQFIDRYREWFNDAAPAFKNKYTMLKDVLEENNKPKTLVEIHRHKINLFGFRLWKIDYGTKWTRCYLCGIRAIKIRRRNKNKKIYPFHIDNTALLSALKQLPEFAYIPNAGNLGDMLIAASSLLFFQEHQLAYRPYNESNAEYIVYGGGGVWTADYKNLWEPLLPIFKRAKKVVILPSSFYQCTEFVKELDERFIVFCREKQSYDYLNSFHTTATILLDHDMALRMDDTLWKKKISRCAKFFKDCLTKCKRQSQKELSKPVSFLLRKDCESQQAVRSGVDLSSFVFADSKTSEQDILFMAQTMLQLINWTNIVVTDRLHVGIAALLLGKETYLLDNSYKKISNVYNHSLSERAQVFMVKELPDRFRKYL